MTYDDHAESSKTFREAELEGEVAGAVERAERLEREVSELQEERGQLKFERATYLRERNEWKERFAQVESERVNRLECERDDWKQRAEKAGSEANACLIEYEKKEAAVERLQRERDELRVALGGARAISWDLNDNARRLAQGTTERDIRLVQLQRERDDAVARAKRAEAQIRIAFNALRGDA